MALLKKKPTEQTPEESTKTAASIPKAPKGGLIGLILMLLVAILLAIVISTGVQLMNSSGANQQHLETLQSNLGRTYLKAFNHRLKQLQSATDQVAAQEDLLLMIQVTDKSILASTEARIKSLLTDAAAVRIIPQGQAQLDTQSEIPLTFAGLDMIKRAEKKQSPPIEIHKLNKTNYVQTVSTINNSSGQIVATLLVTYHAQALFGEFYQLDTNIGELKIEQSFLDDSAQLVFQMGNGNQQGYAYSQASDIRHLTVSYQIADQLINQPLLNQAQTLIAGLIAAVLALIGIAAFYYILNSKMNKNMHMLSEFTLSLAGGRKPKQPEFTLGQFETLAQALYQQTKRNGPEMINKLIPSAPDTFENAIKTAPSSDADDLHLDLELDEASMEVVEDHDAHLVSRQIFRAYDIRGRVGDQLTPEVAEIIGQALGSEAYERGQQTIYVGHDGRLSSPDLADALIQGLKSTGRDVIDIGEVATPVVYYAAFTQESNSGIMITGSHNPPEYNGIKIMIDGETLHEEGIKRLYERITENDLLSGEGSYHSLNLDQEYMERIASDIAIAQPLKVVIDAGNGVAGKYAPHLYESIGCDVIPMYCEVDGNFPNHHPDPIEEVNLTDLKARIKEEQADLGIAFDGDGDRIVVVDDQGNTIYSDQLIMMFARDVLSRCPGTDIVYDVKCSSKVGEYISHQGGRPVMWKSGHSLLKTKMLELGSTFGGEMSGHIIFNERWYGFDDGLYAGARLLELLSTDHRPVSEVFKGYPVGVLSPEYHIDAEDQSKFELIVKIKESLCTPAATITEIDGIRVDFDNGWGLVRASNTTPTLTLRFEGVDEDSLALIQGQFREAILSADPSLQIPF